jgi:hypothetical protein
MVVLGYFCKFCHISKDNCQKLSRLDIRFIKVINTFAAPQDCSFSMAGLQAMNQGSALALPMVALALWITWSHHLFCLIVPHHLLYTNALYSVEKGVILTIGHFHSTCNYLGNMCH